MYLGNPHAQMCAQAAQAAGGQSVLLQKIDPRGNTILQQWQFRNDNRIYLYHPKNLEPTFCLTFAGQPGDGAPLALAFPDGTDDNQIWLPVCFQNLGASKQGTSFVLDDKYGSTSANNPLQIYHSNG